MNLYAFLALCFIPLVAGFIVLKILLPHLKVRYCLWSCVLSIVAVLPIAFIQYFVLNLPVFNTNTFISLMVTAIIFNGLIEETVKMFFLALIPQKKLTLSCFLACCLLFGLTLGSFESVIYLVKRIQETGLPEELKGAFKLIVMRMFTAVLIHTFCAGLSGLYLWLFRHKRNNVLPFLYAVLLHGIYNFFAAFTTGYRWFSIVAILFALLECRIWWQQSKLPPENEKNPANPSQIA